MQVQDPVCGMQCDEKSAVGKVDYQGRTYYFCADDCKEEFEKNPQLYIQTEGGQSPGRAGSNY